MYLSFHFGYALNVRDSLCLWWRVFPVLFIFMQAPGFPGKKGEQVSYQILFYCITSHFNRAHCWLAHHPSLWWVSSPLLFSHRESQAWLVLRGRGEGKENLDREERKWATGGWWCSRKYGIICVHCTFIICHPSEWHFLSFWKGSPGSGGSGVVGPKGDPGERVSSHWSHRNTSLSEQQMAQS